MNELFWGIKTWLYKLFRPAWPFQAILDKENENLKILLMQAAVSDKKAADVGTGTGNVLRFLGQAKLIVGLDFTRSMLVEAKAIFPQAKFLQAKAQTIPLKSDCLDLITAIGLIEYMSDAVPFLAEASRLLKKGGFLVMSFSPANVWTRMRAIFGHRVYAWNLEGICRIAVQQNFQLKDFRQSLMQFQVLFRK